jgi:crotonobetainyl-CoA:carnitine CoA-transferase CaiB-like acyl-CoA transferase
MINDPRYATDAARVARRSEVITIFERWLTRFADVAAAIAHLEAHKVPCASVLSEIDALTARGVLVTGAS